MSKIIIACGGTGGHLAPGIAVAEELQERGHKCLMLISKKQVDSALVEKYGHLNFMRTPGRAFAGGIVSRVAFIFSLISGIISSRRLLKKEEPDLVLLFGGFVSVALGLASKTLGVPVVLHEANCQPGRAVQLIKRLSTRIYLPDGINLSGVPPERVRYYGYPVRKEIRRCSKVEARQRLGIKVPRKLLVVIGGSQGAAALNDWVTNNFRHLAKAGISVYCVAGLGHSSEDAIHEAGLDGDVITASFVEFSDRMGDVISAADFVVSRAGAGSIAELIRCRAPSILVPYPYAADDHQHANALSHEQAGAGILLSQTKLETLTDRVTELMFDDLMLANFESSLERLDRFESSERIATDLLELCESRQTAKVNMGTVA